MQVIAYTAQPAMLTRLVMCSAGLKLMPADLGRVRYTSAVVAICRRSETEADSIGMRLAAKACYDPAAAGTFLSPLLLKISPFAVRQVNI